LAEIDPRPYQAQLAQFEGQMARDQALLANARIDLERYRTLYAQDSIAKQQVDTQEALVRQYEGTVKADQGQVDNVRLQLAYAREQKVKLATGALLTVDNQIDPATGTVKLKAQFSNEDGGLFPNQFVNVRMLLDTRRGATLVPNAAVVRGGQGTFVYVIKEDR